MGASSMFLTRKNLVALVFIGCSTVACAQSSQLTPNPSEVTKALSLKLAEATNRYADKLEACDALAKQLVSSKVNSEELERRGISKDDAVVATGHLYFRNKGLCSRQEMLEFAYQLGNIHQLRDELEMDASTIKKANAFAPYQTARELQLEVEFDRLSQNTKVFFIDALGDQPFDYLEVLERLR